MNDSPGSEGVQWGLPGRQYFKFTVGAGRGSQQAELPQAGCRSGEPPLPGPRPAPAARAPRPACQ